MEDSQNLFSIQGKVRLPKSSRQLGIALIIC